MCSTASFATNPFIESLQPASRQLLQCANPLNTITAHCCTTSTKPYLSLSTAPRHRRLAGRVDAVHLCPAKHNPNHTRPPVQSARPSAAVSLPRIDRDSRISRTRRETKHNVRHPLAKEEVDRRLKLCTAQRLKTRAPK